MVLCFIRQICLLLKLQLNVATSVKEEYCPNPRDGFILHTYHSQCLLHAAKYNSFWTVPVKPDIFSYKMSWALYQRNRERNNTGKTEWQLKNKYKIKIWFSCLAYGIWYVNNSARKYLVFQQVFPQMALLSISSRPLCIQHFAPLTQHTEDILTGISFI